MSWPKFYMTAEQFSIQDEDFTYGIETLFVYYNMKFYAKWNHLPR